MEVRAAKHEAGGITPGPWQVGEDGTDVFTDWKRANKGDEPEVICRTNPFDESNIPVEEQRANARAIALVPELLDLAHDIAVYLDGEDVELFDRAEAILARAAGEKGGE